MSLLSTIPFSSQTVYSLEFPPKFIERTTPKFKVAETGIIVSANPFPETGDQLCKEVDAFRQKVQTMHPSLQHIMRHPIDINIINKYRELQSKTTYQSHYKLTDGHTSSVPPSERYVPLPKGWCRPATTQQASFRQPTTWGSSLFTSKPFKPKHNLLINKKEQQILNVTTGETEYIGQIGGTAAQIFQNAATHINN